MVEESRRCAHILNFLVPIDFSRDSKGRKLVDPRPFTPVDLKVDREQWFATASAMTSQDLARELGITDRQARRIKAGKVTKDRLTKWAAERPTLMDGANIVMGLP